MLETIKLHNEITNNILYKIGLMKVNDDHWICKANVGADGEASANVGPSSTIGDNNVIIPYVPPVERGELLSKFEQMMLNKLNIVDGDQREHYEFFAARFQHLDDQLEVVQEQLTELDYGWDN